MVIDGTSRCPASFKAVVYEYGIENGKLSQPIINDSTIF